MLLFVHFSSATIMWIYVYICKAAIVSFIKEIHEHLKGKPYHSQVYDVIAISNKCDKGVGKLRKQIVEAVTKEQYWGEKQPLKWLLLAERLKEEGSSRQKEPVLKLKEVVKIAEEFDMSRDKVLAFLNHSHQLGDVIHFDEKGLRDTVIMDPQWLINMFRYGDVLCLQCYMIPTVLLIYQTTLYMLSTLLQHKLITSLYNRVQHLMTHLMI